MFHRQLTHIETNFLMKGFNFPVTYKDFPNKDHALKDLEMLTQSLQNILFTSKFKWTASTKL